MSAVDTKVRDRLKDVRDRKADALDRRKAARKQVDDAKEAFANVDVRDQKITEIPEFGAAEQAVRELGTVDDELADLKVAEESILKLFSHDLDDVTGSKDDGMQFVGGGWDARKLLGSGSTYQEARERGLFSSTAKFGTIQLGQIASRDDAVRFLAELPGAPAGPVSSPDTAGLIQPDRRGLIAPILRPLRLLDLIPTGTTDSNSIEYVQVTAIPSTSGVVSGPDPDDTGATVNEGVVKPEVGLSLEDATAPVRTIAGWIKVNRQAMDDAAGLTTLINTLLPYDVRRKIEAEIIAGNGSGQHLTGILHQTGLGAPAFVAGDNVADAILRAMTTVILTDQEPNFAALNPMDWQDLLLMREDNTNRTGMYLYGGPASMAAATIWGLTVTPSTVLAAGSPLVGDTNGATLLFREGVNVKTSDSDQDDFVRNRVTVLAEARVAFPVWRPSAFAVAATAGSGS